VTAVIARPSTLPMPYRRPNAFTLMEILVVAVILAVIGAMIVPRLAGQRTFTVQLTGERVAEMLGTFAFRSSLAGQPVALMRNPETAQLEIWVLDMDPEHPDRPAEWRPDRFSRTCVIPDGVAVLEVRANGQRLVPDEWRVIASPGIPRPRLEIVIGDDATEITVVLEPRASAPYLTSEGRPQAIGRTPIDLDREGRERELW